MTTSLHIPLCDVAHSQLLVIDIQDRLASAMPEKVMQQVIKNTNVLLKASSELNIPVIRSEQYPQGLGPTHTEVNNHLPQHTRVLEKTCFACTGAEGFSERIDNQRRQVILCGIESHICVLQTAIQLHQQGFEVYVVEDAVCSRNKHHYKNALQRLRQAGVIVTNVESVLFEWLRDAQHESFRALSKLIR